MSLDIVRRVVSNIRLAAMLSSMHDKSIAKMVHYAINSEKKVKGGDNWRLSRDSLSNMRSGVEAFSSMRFEFPSENCCWG